MSVREDLLKRRAELSASKQALLQKRLKRVEIEDASPAIPSISKRSPEVLIPLSFAQERLWFIQELEPDNPFYNELIAMRMSGPLDLPALPLLSMQLCSDMSCCERPLRVAKD